MFTEFFCGIGGFAACLPGSAKTSTCLSIDINQNALAVHELNFGHRRLCKTIESLQASDLSESANRLWWMSPPCQPFTRRGRQRDLDDSRSAGFKNMVRLIEQCLPENIGMENVPEFSGSESEALLKRVLGQCGYSIQETVFCASDLGALNRRRRYYLVASRQTELAALCPPASPSELESTPGSDQDRSWIRRRELRLEADVDFATFGISDDWRRDYESAIHVVCRQQLQDGSETTSCFTSAYGRSPVRSGSYLRTEQGIRLFTPREVLWQLGFDESFRLPDLPPEKLWPLTGNTLALPAVRFILQHLPLD